MVLAISWCAIALASGFFDCWAEAEVAMQAPPNNRRMDRWIMGASRARTTAARKTRTDQASISIAPRGSWDLRGSNMETGTGHREGITPSQKFIRRTSSDVLRNSHAPAGSWRALGFAGRFFRTGGTVSRGAPATARNSA